MRKHILAALAALLVSPAAAQADKAECPSKLERGYSKRYRQVDHRYGGHAQGRDIRLRGTVYEGTTFVTPCGFLRVARRQLERLLVTPTYLAVHADNPKQPPAGVKTRSYEPVGLAACIVFHESRFDTQASNGTHWGIAQWTIEAWLRHGGGRFAASPLGATYQEQLVVLNRGLSIYGCRDWCPFDPC